MTQFKIVCKRTQEAVTVVSAENKEEALLVGAQRKRLSVDQFSEIYEVKKYGPKKEENGKCI